MPVGEEMLGRVVNALGQPIDGKGQILTDKTEPIEKLLPELLQESQFINRFRQV